MQRILAIAVKDFRLTFRDRAALLSMLATPFAIALVLGFAFGGLGGSSGPGGVATVIVDGDGGEAGQTIVAALSSDQLSSLVSVTVTADPAAARALVDDNKASAAVIIPPGLTARVRSAAVASAPAARVEIYTNPTLATGAQIIRSVVDGVLARIGSAAAAAQLTVQGVAPLLPQRDPGIASAAAAAAAEAATGPGIALAATGGGSEGGVDYGKIVGPSMAVMFLMFTVTAGARGMLDERQAGTLARLLVTPTTRAQILLGKGCGIFLNGAAQMAILLAASTALFGISWGSIPALVGLTAALVLAATGWGVLIAGLARTPAQVTQAGIAVSLVFGLAAGNLIPRSQLPELLRTISLVTPNALGLEGYQSLAGGNGLGAVALPVLALLVMAGLLFAVGAVASRGRLTAA
jgi:ABC-2 type transport system permease protein